MRGETGHGMARGVAILAALTSFGSACGAAGGEATEPSPAEPTEPTNTGEGGSAAVDPCAACDPQDSRCVPQPGCPAEEPQEAARAAAPPAEPEPAPEPEPVVVVPPHPPGDGRLDIGRPEIARGGGRINAGLFARAIERKRGGMLACYNMPLGADPELRGELLMVLVIDAQGMVGVNVDTDDEALAAAGVTSCVRQKLGQVDFSRTPPGQELWIRVPLSFRP